MRDPLAQSLMEEFAEATGISSDREPRRYLWTDAFAVCNFLGLYRRTGNKRYLNFARTLIEQVHHVLGRHRAGDVRRGWISGLTEEEGEQHPTAGGLRIGKKFDERAPGQPENSRLEWDRDGQYFHYLTKWMRALACMAKETGEMRFRDWAVELAVTAHRAFTHATSPGSAKRIVWKMSIDLSRPLVSSTGQHDALDGVITCLELQVSGGRASETFGGLADAIDDMNAMCTRASWITDDPLGVGGLLDNAARLARLIALQCVNRRDLFKELVRQAHESFKKLIQSYQFDLPAEYRLAFRELGLAIGIHAIQGMRPVWVHDTGLAAACSFLIPYEPLAKRIENFWSEPPHRLNPTWIDHCDINSVMLATSLAPEGYLQI